MQPTSSRPSNAGADKQARFRAAVEVAKATSPGNVDGDEAVRRRDCAAKVAGRSSRGQRISEAVKRSQKRIARAKLAHRERLTTDAPCEPATPPVERSPRGQHIFAVVERAARRRYGFLPAKQAKASHAARHRSGHRRASGPAGTRSRGSKRTASRAGPSGDDSGGSSDPDPDRRQKALCCHCASPTYGAIDFHGNRAPLCTRCVERLDSGQRPVLRSLERRFPAEVAR